MAKPTTVDGYFEQLPETSRSLLEELRKLVRATAPTATEALKWGAPAAVHRQGTILFVYSAHQGHANFTFTPSTREAFTRDLEEFETGKGSVKLPYEAPAPTELLKRMIQYRVEEFEHKGVKWM